MSEKQKPYSLLNWEKARDEGRLVIEKPESPIAHRQFNLTLRATQILKAFKDCLRAGEYEDTKDEELMKVYKALVDYLLRRNPTLVEPMYRHFKGRLEKYYIERKNATRR